MRPRTLLVATGAALVVAGVGACGAAGSHPSHAARAAHSASASPSQRSTSQGSASQSAGTTAQTGSGSAGSTTGTTITTGTGAAGGQDETVGVWPVSTRTQAIQLQQSADAGHQPWLTDPAQVAAAYARSVMSVSQPNVERISATRYVVRVAPNVETVLTLAQPVRPGSGGIWIVTSATQQRY